MTILRCRYDDTTKFRRTAKNDLPCPQMELAPSGRSERVELITLDRRTAAAVVVVLRRGKIPTEIAVDEFDGTVTLFVEEQDRRAALSTITQYMETITSLARLHEADDPDAVLDDVDLPVLVMDRLRSFAIVFTLLLIPLMIVTLSPALPSRTWVLGVLAGASMAVLFGYVWNRWFRP